MVSLRRLTVVLALASCGTLAGLAGPRDALSASSARSVVITACKSAVKQPSGYWNCVGPFGLGIPASSPKVQFFVDTKGSWAPGTVTFNILDGKARQPLTTPVTLHLPRTFKTGFHWFFSLNGSFPKATIVITTTVGGQTIGTGQFFRFV